MKRSRSDERHLRQRGDHWHYYRRVPKKYARFDDRGTIRLAFGTTSLETARIRRDELLKIAHPYSPDVFRRIDKAFPERAAALGRGSA